MTRAAKHISTWGKLAIPMTRAARPALMLLAGWGLLFVATNLAEAQGYSSRGMLPPEPKKEQGITDKIGSSIKKGASKIASIFKDDDKPAERDLDSAVSVFSDANPSPRFYVQVARLAEESGNLVEAKRHYDKAMAETEGDARVMVAYAGFLERCGQVDQAVELYQRSLVATSDDPAVLNEMALCLARAGHYEDAVSRLRLAIAAHPNEPVYRHNIATILVRMGNPSEAFLHLSVVHKEEVAYYNVAYLLLHAGNYELAEKQFRHALDLNPKLAEAKIWLEKLDAHRRSKGVAQEAIAQKSPDTWVDHSADAARMPTMMGQPEAPATAGDHLRPLPPTEAGSRGPSQGIPQQAGVARPGMNPGVRTLPPYGHQPPQNAARPQHMPPSGAATRYR